MNYTITNYIVTYEEYLDIRNFFKAFSALDATTLGRVELYIIQNTQVPGTVNEFKSQNSIIHSFLKNTSLSRQQIDRIIKNVNSIGNYIVPMQLSSKRVKMIFIAKKY